MFENIVEMLRVTIDTGDRIVDFLKEKKNQEANITLSSLIKCLEKVLKEFSINKLKLEEKNIKVNEDEILAIFKDMLKAMENKDYFALKDILEFGLLELLERYQKQILNVC